MPVCAGADPDALPEEAAERAWVLVAHLVSDLLNAHFSVSRRARAACRRIDWRYSCARPKDGHSASLRRSMGAAKSMKARILAAGSRAWGWTMRMVTGGGQCRSSTRCPLGLDEPPAAMGSTSAISDSSRARSQDSDGPSRSGSGGGSSGSGVAPPGRPPGQLRPESRCAAACQTSRPQPRSRRWPPVPHRRELYRSRTAVIPDALPARSRLLYPDEAERRAHSGLLASLALAVPGSRHVRRRRQRIADPLQARVFRQIVERRRPLGTVDAHAIS
jgi:hypothetical protein